VFRPEFELGTPRVSSALPLEPTFWVLLDIISFSLYMSLIYNYGPFEACGLKTYNLICTVLKQWRRTCSIVIWCQLIQLVLLNFCRFCICFFLLFSSCGWDRINLVCAMVSQEHIQLLPAEYTKMSFFL
jgi:hypothetical protein